MNRLTIQVRGLKELRAALHRERGRLLDAFAAAIYAEAMKADARGLDEDMAPWDTGRMKQSHYVAPPTVSGSTVTCELGYGVDYAIYVHERTELRHPHGQAKWLKRVLDEIARGFTERIAAGMERALASGLSIRALPAQAPKDVGGNR